MEFSHLPECSPLSVALHLAVMRELRKRTARTLEAFRRLDEQPTTYSKGRRCPACSAFLCSYNEGPLCWPCSPGGEGVVLPVGNGQWRRFKAVKLMRDSPFNDELRAQDFAELMEE